MNASSDLRVTQKKIYHLPRSLKTLVSHHWLIAPLGGLIVWSLAAFLRSPTTKRTGSRLSVSGF